jgi:hypothetical protein
MGVAIKGDFENPCCGQTIAGGRCVKTLIFPAKPFSMRFFTASGFTLLRFKQPAFQYLSLYIRLYPFLCTHASAASARKEASHVKPHLSPHPD